MIAPMYFIISASPNGILVESKTYDELIDDLNIGHYEDYEFVDQIPDPDPNYWGSKGLIIKGTPIIPQPKQTVTTWEVT